MKYLTITLFSLLLLFGMTSLQAQNGYSVADAIPVDFTVSNTVTFNSVNSDLSDGDAQGTQDGPGGGCRPDCCSTVVYKVTIPQEGALYVSADNFVASGMGVWGYTGAANASSPSDLTFYNNEPAEKNVSNRCTFRDTLYWGRGYQRWAQTPYWFDRSLIVGGWNTATMGEYSIPAGTYYIHFFNRNQKGGTVATTSNLTFEFIPYCIANQPEMEVEGNSVSITDGDNTPSTSDDTDFGTVMSNASPISKTFTIKNVHASNQLDISSATITGNDAANFSITTAPSATVAGNSTTTMTVQFTPNKGGVNKATIEIENTDCDQITFNFDLKAFVLGSAPNDKRGNMITLDGSDDYVEINSVATQMDGVTEFTLEAWFNADATQSGNDRIISINSSGGGNVYLLYLDDGVIETYDGSDADAYGSDLRGTGWHHVAVAHDNSRDYVYLDGVLLGDGAANVSAFASNNQWSIGQEFDGGSTGDFFKGSFDEVRIWKDVRTQAEIQTNMNVSFTQAQLLNLDDLIAYYQFDNDDASGTTDGVKDVLGNNGTVKNGGTYSASEVAVGNGASEKQTVNAVGTYDFSTVGVTLTFSGGTVPDGDIIITKITTESPASASAGKLANEPTTYWVIRNLGANNSGLTCNAKFKFDDGQIDDNLPANHRIHKRGTNQFEVGDWTNLVPSSVNSTAGDNHIAVNITGFSQFGASSSTSDFQSVMPVELVYFEGVKTTKGTRLIWQTAMEKNNEGFEIQRAVSVGSGQSAVSSLEWQAIGFELGQGTTQRLQNYQFDDLQPKDGINYYRLKQIDFDGAYEYSDVVSIDCSKPVVETKIFPNPVRDELNIVDGQGQATIYNTLGQPVESFKIQHSTFKIDTSDLAKGQYILHIQTQNGNIITKRFMK